jgi:hypothetical protein
MGFLDIQFAARKTRPLMKNAGPWAGSVVVLNPQGVGVKCTLEKWTKAKTLMQELFDQINAKLPLNRKNLEKPAGSWSMYSVPIQK